jgi:hypothetical protein
LLSIAQTQVHKDSRWGEHNKYFLSSQVETLQQTIQKLMFVWCLMFDGLMMDEGSVSRCTDWLHWRTDWWREASRGDE